MHLTEAVRATRTVIQVFGMVSEIPELHWQPTAVMMSCNVREVMPDVGWLYLGRTGRCGCHVTNTVRYYLAGPLPATEMKSKANVSVRCCMEVDYGMTRRLCAIEPMI